MKLNCLIIDDEPYARKGIAEYIADINFLELKAEASNPIDAIGLIEEHKIDLIFLDIHMPKMNGLDFLNSNNKMPLVVFTTAHAEYALKAFEYTVVDYLLKPISFDRFFKAAKKAFDVYVSTANIDKSVLERDNYFFVKSNGKYVKLVVDELVYIEGLQNYINVYTLAKKTTVYTTLKSVEGAISSQKFIRIHKSYIINIHKIDSFSREEVTLGTITLPVGKAYYDDVYSKLIEHKIIKR